MSDLKQKRGRKCKNTQEDEPSSPVENVDEPEMETVVMHKKRGRKPKGGKIIYQTIETNDTIESKPNIVHNKGIDSNLNSLGVIEIEKEGEL